MSCNTSLILQNARRVKSLPNSDTRIMLLGGGGHEIDINNNVRESIRDNMSLRRDFRFFTFAELTSLVSGTLRLQRRKRAK
jgi:hypothetical protein